MKNNIKNIIIEMSKEFDDCEGDVTCEISIHKNQISEMEQLVKEKTDIKLGKWVLLECETCVGYHGEGFIHASIEKTKVIPEFQLYSNYIKTIL